MLSSDWSDQAYKAGAVKVLHNFATISTLPDSEVQLRISVLRTPQCWTYVDSNARWCHSLKGDKVLNMGKNMTDKESNGENERSGICILSNINEHPCTNICNMTVNGRFVD